MNNPLVQPDPGLFIWTIVVFLVLLSLLAKFAWRPLLEALDSRQAAIKKSLDDAKEAGRELERLTQESAEILRTARGEAESIVSRGRVDAERLREETNLPVSVADDPLAAVVLGTGKMLNDFNLLRKIAID